MYLFLYSTNTGAFALYFQRKNAKIRAYVKKYTQLNKDA